MTGFRKEFLFIRIGLRAIPSSHLIKENGETKCKITWQSPNSQKLGCFSVQIFKFRENEFHSPLFCSITRVLVLCSTLCVILIKIYRMLFKKNVNKHYKMGGNYKTDPHIMTPWRVKSSESKISSYYKASIVSHSLRKHALVSNSDRLRDTTFLS